ALRSGRLADRDQRGTGQADRHPLGDPGGLGCGIRPGRRSRQDDCVRRLGLRKGVPSYPCPGAAGRGIRPSARSDLRDLALDPLAPPSSGSLLPDRGLRVRDVRIRRLSDPARRGRGVRALDLLVSLKRDPSVDVLLVDDEPGSGDEPVDTRVLRLARSRGAVLVTNDNALARMAAAIDVPVRSINALADALRPPVVPGERVPLRLVRRGRETGQAVGYLDDGNMVVAEQAEHLLGDTFSIA